MDGRGRPFTGTKGAGVHVPTGARDRRGFAAAFEVQALRDYTLRNPTTSGRKVTVQ